MTPGGRLLASSLRRRARRAYPDIFSSSDPFRPVNIRAIYDDEDNSTVIAVWDGQGTTTAGTTYHNTYAWFLTLSGGKIVDGTAFYDSIAFNELWDGVTP